MHDAVRKTAEDVHSPGLTSLCRMLCECMTASVRKTPRMRLATCVRMLLNHSAKALEMHVTATHGALRVVPLSNSVPHLAPFALLHDDVDVLLLLTTGCRSQSALIDVAGAAPCPRTRHGDPPR